MIRHALSLVLAAALAGPVLLTGCDRIAGTSADTHIERAKDFEDQGDFKDSIIELKNAIQKNPDHPQARLLLGQLYLKVGLGAEAEKEFSRAQQLGISRESLLPQLGEALLLVGAHQRLLDEILPTEKTSPTNRARIFALRANALFQLGRSHDACALFRNAYEHDKTLPSPYWGMALCAATERNLDQARQWLDDALKLPTEQSQTWAFLGDLGQLEGKPAAALAAYGKALELAPHNLLARYNRAPLLLAENQADAARKDIAFLRKHAPHAPQTQYLTAMLHYSQQQLSEARDILQETLKAAPDHAPSQLLGAMTYLSLGAHQQAETLAKRFLTRYPADKQALLVLAATQLGLNQPDRALVTLTPLLGTAADDPRVLGLAGEASLMLRDPERAVDYLASAAALDPRNVPLQTQLSLGLLATGDARGALSGLQQAAALDASQPGADLLLIRTHLGRKEYDEALSAIDALARKMPSAPLPHQLRGLAFMGKNNAIAARASFERAAAADPAYFPAASSLAELDLRDNRPDAARKRYERVLEKEPTHLQAMLALVQWARHSKQDALYREWLDKAARAHPRALGPQAERVRERLARGEAQQALVLANGALNANPDNPAALQLLGNTQLAARDFPAAIATFNKLVRLSPQSAEAHMRLALAQIADNKHADARVSLDTTLKLKPDHSQALDAMLRLSVEAGQLDDAMRFARRIQAAWPDAPLGYEREGDVLVLQKRPGQAVALYEQMIAKGAGSTGFLKVHRALVLAGDPAADARLVRWLADRPKDTSARLYAAQYYTETRRPEDAIAAYETLLAQTPDSALLLNNLATLYQETGDRRALATAEKAHKLDPASPAVLDTLGWILVNQGQTARGLELLQQAHAKAPAMPEIRYHLGIALARSGNTARARQILQQLLRDTPAFPQAAAVRDQLSRL